MPWNIYPWYINREPTASELEAGVEPLLNLIRLVPRLGVVLLHGGSAKAGWKRLARRHPELTADRRLTVIPTYHTSRQAFWHSDPLVREQRRGHIRAAFASAAGLLARTDTPS